MKMHSARRGQPATRRGMLLLMVLTMLSLFLLMGTFGIVMAMRARETARAFAGSIAGPSQLPVIARAATDEALLTLLRGSADLQIKGEVTESLLGDMYGPSGTARFVDEPWDAFDDDNKFLTHLSLNANGQVTAAIRPAFQKTGSTAPLPCEVDNDGDSVADGVWLKNALPSMNLPGGGELTFRLSYLVVDLDGRINVNTHGKRSDAPAAQTGEIGPADVNGSSLLTTPVWNLLMERTGGQLLSEPVSPGVQWSPVPPISLPVDGRFGGLKDTNGSPESDTYKLRLDLEAPRPVAITNASTQNPFTLGELERVLRQFDTDASTLPPRLAGILHDRAERARMRITTDSWEALTDDRVDISWVAPNSGRPEEQAFFNLLCQKIATRLYPKWNAPTTDPPDPDKAIHLAKLQEVEQWVANIIEFRDRDTSVFPVGFNRLTGGTVVGVEPSELTKLDPPLTIPGGPLGWDKGQFLSYAQVLGVPKGNLSQIAERRQNLVPPEVNTSLAIDTPELLEFLLVPTLFTKTYWEVYAGPGDPSNVARLPKREPGRINVNTCDPEVWKLLLGEAKDNPFDDSPATAAKSTGLLLKSSLVFGSDGLYKAESVNHDVANRLANVATIRSHVFAIWITVEITDSSATSATPSCYRLFAIVDRSIPVTYAEGQNNNVRDMIRLQRFLN